MDGWQDDTTTIAMIQMLFCKKLKMELWREAVLCNPRSKRWEIDGYEEV